MKKLLTALLIWSCFVAIGQQPNVYKYLDFKTDFERESWRNPSADYLALSMSIDSTFTAKEAADFKVRLESFYKENSINLKPGKKRTKEIAKLYVAIHDAFLQRYREKVNFSDLVRKSEYNCVTASVLYVEILNHYKIPFTILNEPTHVFLVAYPEEEYIVLQTTSPKFEDFQINMKLRNLKANELVRDKIITQYELDTLGMHRAVEVYYHNQKRVDVLELIGYDYYNQMVRIMDSKTNFQQCSEMGLRAMYLMPYSEEFSDVFYQTGYLGVAATAFTNTAGFYLSMSNLTSQPKNKVTETSLPMFFVISDIYQKLMIERPELNEVFMKMVAMSTQSFDVLSDPYSWEEEIDYSHNEEDLYEVVDAVLEVLEKNDFEDLNSVVNDLVIDEEWRKRIMIQAYTLRLNFLLEETNESPKQCADKLRAIDPDNAILKRIEAEILLADFADRFRNNEEDVRLIFGDLVEEAAALEMENYMLFDLGMDLFRKLEEDCKDSYYNGNINRANEAFEVCLGLYKELHQLEEVDENDREALEYKMGNLFLKKSENGSSSFEKSIINQGHTLIPTHVVLKARYQHYRR